MLFLHGALGTSKQFERFIPHFSSDVAVHTLTFSGHGGRPLDGKYSMEVFMRDILDFMDEKGMEKTDIFGYSMGGYAALYTALRHPERIGSIITLGTKFDWSAGAAEKETKMLDPEKIEAKVPAFAEKLKQVHTPEGWKGVLHKTADLMHGLANGQGLSWEDLKQIQHPVTICLGDQDIMVSREESEKAAALLPNGTFNLLEGVPHPIEKVDVKILVELDSLEGRQRRGMAQRDGKKEE